MSKKKTFTVYICNFLLLGMAYCGFLHIHYGLDSYANLYRSNVASQLSITRYVIYFAEMFFEKIGLDLFAWQQLFMVLSLAVMAAASVLLFRLLYREDLSTVQLIGIESAVILCFVNAFITELFSFSEYVIYNSVGIFLSILAAYLLFRNRTLCYLGSLLSLMLSLWCYQSNISVYLIIVLGVCQISGLIMCRRKDDMTDRSAFLPVGSLYIGKPFIYGIAIGGTASILHLAIHKLLVYLGITIAPSRDASLSLNTILSNLKVILFNRTEGQAALLIRGYGLLPKYVLAGTIILLVLCLAATLIYIKRSRLIPAIVFLAFLMYCCVFAPHLISGSVWIYARTAWPLFFFISMLACMSICAKGSGKTLQTLAMGITVCFLAINYWSFQGVVIDQFSVNRLDQSYAYDVYNQIVNYEDKTGIQVTTIAIANDTKQTIYYKYTNYHYLDLNERGIRIAWGDVNIINTISKRHFKRVNMDEDIFNAHFADKDWDYFCPEEQLYFEGDTLYWCKY